MYKTPHFNLHSLPCMSAITHVYFNISLCNSSILYFFIYVFLMIFLHNNIIYFVFPIYTCWINFSWFWALNYFILYFIQLLCYNYCLGGGVVVRTTSYQRILTIPKSPFFIIVYFQVIYVFMPVFNLMYHSEIFSYIYSSMSYVHYEDCYIHLFMSKETQISREKGRLFTSHLWCYLSVRTCQCTRPLTWIKP